jgi:hypothetical protein
MIAPMAETQSKSTNERATPSASPSTSQSKPTTKRARSTEETATAAGMAGLPVEIPTEDGAVVPTPGDPRTEPVATAAQSWVPGRVGPRTIPEDATALAADPGSQGLDEVLPGTVLADTPEGVGYVPDVQAADPIGENLARIMEDQEAGVPLNDAGQRVDELGRPLPRAEQTGRISR